jgi:lysozyme
MTPRNRRAAALVIATAIAVPAEGLRQFAYYDPPGILTVCYGSTTNVVKGKKYTIEECKARLSGDMLHAVETVERCVPGLPVNVLAAFADAVYNLGATIVCNLKQSTAARYLHAGKIIDACNQLPRWNKASVAGVMIPLPGLTARRGVEQQLCLQSLA